MPAGTVVASGSLVSPGGQQGTPGPGQNASWQGFVSKVSAYTLTTADSAKYIICSGGSWTLTLPAAAPGLIFQVRNDMGISGVTGTITLQPTGGTIDGASSLALLAQQEVTILTDGTNWRTLGRQRTVVVGTQDLGAGGPWPSTVLLPPGYRYYEFYWENLVATYSTSDNLTFQVSFDGGTTFRNGATDYRRQWIYNSTASALTYVDTSDAVVYLNLLYQGASASAQVVFWPGDGTTPGLARWDYTGAGHSGTFGMKIVGGGWINVSGLGIANAIRWNGYSASLSKGSLNVKGIV